MASPPGENVDPEYENGVDAETACSGAGSDGAAPANQPLSIGLVLVRSSLSTSACTAKSVSGTAGGFIRRQSVTTRVSLDLRTETGWMAVEIRRYTTGRIVKIDVSPEMMAG
jgi:hypothetical protein